MTARQLALALVEAVNLHEEVESSSTVNEDGSVTIAAMDVRRVFYAVISGLVVRDLLSETGTPMERVFLLEVQKLHLRCFASAIEKEREL